MHTHSRSRKRPLTARVPLASCSRATSASSLPRQHKSMSFTLATCVSTARELEVTTMEALAAAVAVAGETLAEACRGWASE